MTLVQRLSDRGAADVTLNELEAKIGSTLPADYCRFMSELNGGRPEPSGFQFQTSDGISDSSIRYFLTLDEREKRYSVHQFLDRYRDRIPELMLPVACDSFGNIVLLDVGARSYGSLFFWDHEQENADEGTSSNIFVIAPSFTKFLELLE
ncbi:MAG: hypothetical protein JWM11_6989 [Planctomycetaceae bacterium]|nr:hypothetical protein [Planctomycetaceae bacterium]